METSSGTAIPEAVQSEIRSALTSIDGIKKAIEKLTNQAEGISGHINRRVIEVLGIEQGGKFDPDKMVYWKKAESEGSE